MIDFKNDNYADNLPDCYRKDTESNNHKLLEIERLTVEKHLDDIYEIYGILDLNNARGQTLDRYGERVGQSRGIASDELYILLIKAKIMRSLGNGSYPSIHNSLCMTFACEPEEVSIKESETYMCTVEDIKLPLDVINRVGLTYKQVIALVKSMLPICIRIDNVSLDGTFEFSNIEDDYNEEKGFCDIEGGNIGGYLGYLSSDESEEVLPI